MHLVAQNGELADTETRVLDFEDVPVIEGAPIRARSKALEAMIVSSSATWENPADIQFDPARRQRRAQRTQRCTNCSLNYALGDRKCNKYVQVK